MRIDTLCVISALLLASPVGAQNSDAPLSAIDWLTQRSESAILKPVVQPRAAPSERPVTGSAQTPVVTVTPLDGHVAKRLGLLPYSVTGLSPDLWSGSDTDTLARPLQASLSQRLPAAQELLVSVLLAEADQPQEPKEAERWLLQRIDALIQLGALDPARALLQQADPASSRSVFARWLDVGLLTRSDGPPCAALVANPALRPGEAARVYCTARSGDFETAALLFGTASALGILSETSDLLLARFLDPELFEDAALPRAPLRPNALTFRLFEAAGAPLPTPPLPIAFAHSDLDNAVGWKAQLEAAERLTRAGVLPSNQLLGLYSDRKPAASGGIWDRVSALQAFEKALNAGDADKTAKALPAMWRGMQSAGLEVAFSDLFADPLTKLPLSGSAADIAFRMELLSHSYELAKLPDGASDATRFLTSVAKGTPDAALARSDAARGVVTGFADVSRPAPAPGTLGATLLAVLGDLSDAGRGDLAALTRALQSLRALGLEDTARRTSLQYLILQADA